MANNYLQFSTDIEDLSHEERAWWTKAIEDLDKGEEEHEGYVDFQWAFQGGNLWLHAEESGDVNQLCDVVHEFIKANRPEYIFTIEWGETCSRPRLDEFGGGAAVVTQHDIHWMTTGSWVSEMIATLPCPIESCDNRGRYNSGYCGLHDIEFNEGNGVLRGK